MLVAIGGPPSALGIAVGFVVGVVITAMTRSRSPGRCGSSRTPSTGADRAPPRWSARISGFALFLGGQTYGFGLFAMPPTDSRTLMFRWISAIATSMILAGMSAAIGLVMWRVAYRRIY